MAFKFIFLLLITLSIKSFSQTQLEFNRIISIDSTYTYSIGSGNYTLSTETYIVPEGKTWKIQFLSYSVDSWKINGTYISLFKARHQSGSGAYYSTDSMIGTIWLNENDEISGEFTGSTNGSTFQRYFYISAIEFNLNFH